MYWQDSRWKRWVRSLCEKRGCWSKTASGNTCCGRERRLCQCGWGLSQVSLQRGKSQSFARGLPCRRPSDQSERGISEEWSERQLLFEEKWDRCEIERRQGWRGGFQWLQWVETTNYQLKFKSKGMRWHNWSVPLWMKWCTHGPTHLYLVRKSHCKEIMHVLVKSDSREKLYLKHQRNIRIYNPES